MTDILTRAHPIWELMTHQGRSLAWLARRTGYTSEYVRHIKAGDFPATAKFRAACSRELDAPESFLFLSSECLPDATDDQSAAVLGRPESDLFHVSEPTPEPNGRERDDSGSNGIPTIVNIVDGTVYLSNDPHEDAILARVLVGGEERR